MVTDVVVVVEVSFSGDRGMYRVFCLIDDPYGHFMRH